MAHDKLIARINAGNGRFPFVNVQFSKKKHRPIPIEEATYYLRPGNRGRRTPLTIRAQEPGAVMGGAGIGLLRNASTSSRRRSTPYLVSEVLAVRQIEKFVRLFSIRDRFEVFVGVKIHGDYHINALATSPLYVQNRSPILDL